MDQSKRLKKPRSPRKHTVHVPLEDAAAAAQPGFPVPVVPPDAVPGSGAFTGGGGAWDGAGPWAAANSSEVAGDQQNVQAAPGGLQQQMVSKCMLMNI